MFLRNAEAWAKHSGLQKFDCILKQQFTFGMDYWLMQHKGELAFEYSKLV